MAVCICLYSTYVYLITQSQAQVCEAALYLYIDKTFLIWSMLKVRRRYYLQFIPVTQWVKCEVDS